MTEQNNEQSTEDTTSQTNTPGAEANSETSQSTEQPPEGGDKGGSEEERLSHEDALDALSKARRESAGYRTKLRDLEKRFEGAKTPDEVEALKAELATERAEAERALLVENAALKFDLPNGFAERLRGTTREELEADAKALSEMLGASNGGAVGRGGLDPTQTPHDDIDPVENAKRHSKRGR